MHFIKIAGYFREGVNEGFVVTELTQGAWRKLIMYSICGKMIICKLTGGNFCPGKCLIFEVRNF